MRVEEDSHGDSHSCFGAEMACTDLQLILSPGQTETQLDAGFQLAAILATLFGQGLHALALTYNDLHSL